MDITQRNTPPIMPDDNVDLKKIVDQLYFHKWKILGVSICTFIIAFIYTFTFIPRYQTSLLLQIKQAQSSNILSKLKSGSETLVNTEEAILKTRFILEPVIQNNDLNVIITSSYMPIFGAWIARHYQGEGIAARLARLMPAYSWGEEKVTVKNFIVSDHFLNQSFKLIAGKNNHFNIYMPDGTLLFTGVANQSYQAKGVQLELSDFKAHPGETFSLAKLSPVLMVSGLSGQLQIKSIFGHNPEQETGIIQLNLTDTDPDQAVKTLNAIANYAIEKNVQLKIQETQATLNFLNHQLPEFKAKLTQSENALNQLHSKIDVLNMSVMSQLLMRKLLAAEQALEKLQSEKEELLQSYTPKHPLIISTVGKENVLQAQLTKIKDEIRKFPQKNQVEFDLLREAKIKNLLYLSLLNNKQQLEVMQASIVPDIILLTDAVPPSQLSSGKFLTIMLGFMMGGFISVLFILVRTVLNKTIEDSNELEEKTEIPVAVVLPYSRRQKQLQRAHDKGLNLLGSGQATPLILAKHEPDDITIESLRSLRITLHIQASSPSHNIIAIMGTLGNIGKSFVSLNLAQVMADTGQRTLLIDGDIRKGLLHRSLLQPKSNGLSEYLENKCGLDEIIRHIHDTLFYIPCGAFDTHPIQLFQNARFQTLIETVKNQFDQIIIDTPPIIPVSDSILIAKYCHIKLFVVSAGKDTLGDVKQAVKKARAHGIEINSIVFNHRKPRTSEESRYYYRYAYEATNKTSAVS